VALASTALTMPLTKIFLPHLREAMDRSGVRPKPAVANATRKHKT